jgi:predicted phage terminase large subunit-like protein
MKPSVWELILRPTLADVKGSALFIGTPDGKNHFYDLWLQAGKDDFPEWEQFSYNSTDNPLLDPEEIEAARQSMSSQAFRQEFEASFESFNGGIFKEEWFVVEEEEPDEGYYCIAVDPAGFESINKERGVKGSKLDETAIAIVKVHEDKWWVKEIQHGRWTVKEAAERILDAAVENDARSVGIEAGSLKNALMPYLTDLMRTRGRWVVINDVTHGGRKKTERITWALQGRLEHGKIQFNYGFWNRDFINQMMDFPNSRSHDDLLDALAYIDQVSVADFINDIEIDDWEPLDAYAGY